MFWDAVHETMPRNRLERLQLLRLNRTIRQARNAPFYRKLFALCKVGKLEKLAQLQDLPFTTKQDLRDHFPDGFRAVEADAVVRMHSSTGTTGNPTVIYHSARDIAAWADLVARCLYMAGMRSSDVFQNTMGYGLFTGGLGMHYGAERIGAMVIPVGPGNSRRQLWFMQTFGTTAVHILPNYALRLFLEAKEMGLEVKRELKVRLFFIGAEPHTEEMRAEIEKCWGVKAFNSYGLSEMCGPGVAFECPVQKGMHLWEDQYYLEIIDPVTGKPVPDGQEGELVLTTLNRQANPLLRYRTRDLTRILPGKCPCGRTHRRIERITGRSDDMLIVNGVNLFPMQIEKTILRVPGVGNNYLIELDTEQYMDKITVKVEIEKRAFHGSLEELERLQERIAAELRAEIGVSAAVQLVEPGSLPVSEGKAQRVVDRRTKG